MENNVVEEIEKLLNGYRKEAVHLTDDGIRLIKVWNLYNSDEKYKFDFEVLLRDFILIYKKPINLYGYSLSEKGKKIGLRQLNEKIWVEELYPSYLKHKKFIQDTYNLKNMNKKSKTFVKLDCSQYINQLTGFNCFKSEEQKLTVLGCLNTPKGYTVLVSMSTGSGKSLITQTVAFQEEGLTIVIVPTISLMLDQERNAKQILKEHSHEIFHYYGTIDIKEITEKIKYHQCKLLFISPESLIKNSYLKNMIKYVNKKRILKNLIIDEAHIIFEWGDSFRLDFQCLDIFKKELLSENCELRTFLLSATFSEEDVKILKNLYSNGNDWLELRSDSLRREIHYEFIKATNDSDKLFKLLELVKIIPHPMIIYVSSPEEARYIKSYLRNNDLYNVEIYTGETSSCDREVLLEKWKNNEFSIMVATCAFGVGVDKKDVRSVIHYYLPDNINKYYQEAGRGGRDGNASLSYILYDESDFKSIYNKVKRSVLTTEKLIKRWFSMVNSTKSQKRNDNRILIDTSALPSYYDEYEEKLFINKADINWNVYVLLFLKRHSLISIEDIQFNGKYYEMLIKCLDLRLYIDDVNLYYILDDEREKEWNNVESKCKQMLSMVKKSDSLCVSESFIDIYKKVPYVYCAGCNAHNDIYEGFYSGLPLVSKNNKLLIKNYNCVEHLLIETNSFQSILNEQLNSDFISIISFNKYFIKGLNTSMFDYKEYKEIYTTNRFLLGEKIIFIVDCNIDKFIYFIECIKTTINDNAINVNIICEPNLFIENKQKYFYELFDCARIVKICD